MKLKLDANGNAVIKEVNGQKMPVYVRDDGTESEFDAAGTVAVIARLNGEAKTHREAKEAAEKLLLSYKDINDPVAALKALQTVKSLDDKKLVDAGEIEKLKAELGAAYKVQIQERDDALAKLQSTLYNEMIGGAFSRSKFIAEKVAIPADLVQARFGANFSIEDGEIHAVDHAGNKIYSTSNPGKLAGFDEALSILVNAYPQKAAILKGTGASGSGAQNGGGGPGGKQTLTRAQWEALPPAEKAKAAKEATLVD